MENSWQMKCGSSTQSMASSTSQELRNQMEMDFGHYFYPHITHDVRSTTHERMQDSMSPNIRNISSCRVGHAELGNSFLALLSGPPTLLQSDFQELPNPKAGSASSSKLPLDVGAVNIGAVGSGVLPTASGLLPEHPGNPNMQNGSNLCPVVSSRAVASNNFSSKLVLHAGRQAANSTLQSSDLAKAVIHQLVPGNEKAKDFSPAKGKWQSTSSANVGKYCTSNIPTSQKVPPATSSSVSSQSSICSNVCLRVTCFGASGDLLISNAGLLGIVCSCHHFHTSVAKFCEHLGLHDVNPGEAVHMENGGTIAQWRKLYFQKFGIRVPDDQSGWDWPEGLSGNAASLKSGVVVPNMSNNSDLAKLAGLSGGAIKSGQPLNNILFPKNLHTDQHLVVDALHDKDQRWGYGNSNYLLKGLINNVHSNLHAVPVADNQMMECPISSCLTSLKFVGRGPDTGLQASISAYIDSLVKSRNSSHPASESSKTFDENYDVSKTKNACYAVSAEKIAVSSNMELRLGQPYQQIPSSGNSVPSVVGPKLLDTFVGPRKSLFLEQNAHNATYCGEKVHSRHYFQCSAGPSNLSTRRDQSQLNRGNHAHGISNAVDTDKLEKFEGNMTKSSVVPFLSHFNTLPEKNTNCKNNNNMVKCDYIMPKSLHYESHAAKSNQVSVHQSVGYDSERQLNASELGFFRLKDKGKGVGCVVDGSYAMTDSEFKILQQLKNPGTFTGAVSGSTLRCSSSVHDKSHFFQEASARPPDAFDVKNLLNYPEKLPCLGNSAHVDHVFLRSMGPPVGSGHNLQSQILSMSFPSPTSISTPGMSPSISKLDDIGVSPYLLDENARLLDLRQILELSKQQHTISSPGMDQDKVRLGSVSNVNVQHQLVESLTFREQRLGPNVTSELNHSEVAKVSPPLGAYTRLGINVEKSACVTGLNNFGEFSTLGQGNAFLSREIDLQCQFPQDPLLNKQLSLRSGNVAPSSEHAKCCQGVPCTYFQGHHDYAAYTTCLGGNCEPRVGSFLNSFKEKLGIFNGEACLFAAPEFVKGEIGTKEKTSSSDQRGKLKGQPPKTIACHASQWRDVPSKFKGACDLTYLDQSTDVMDERGKVESQHGDTTAKCSHGTMKMPCCLKEQEVSNVSSGCSTPAVTEASTQVNHMDSSIVVGNGEYVNDHVVDEGSGIDKCWSSDGAQESERSAEFLGSNCQTDFTKEGSSKVLNNQSSRSLLDELKLIDSLTWKKSWNQFHTRLTVHGNANVKKIGRGFKTGKKKRARKYKMLAGPFPVAGPSVALYENHKETVAFQPCSSKDVEMLHPSVQETCMSGACSLRRTSNCGRSTFSASKELSRKRDLCMIYGDMDREDNHQMEVNCNANCRKIHDFSGSKKLKRLWTSDRIRKSPIEEPTQPDPKNTTRCKPVGCMNGSSSFEGNDNSYRKARPVVCGKLGEISSGKLTGEGSPPVKIVSLSRILKTARRCTLPKNCNPKPSFLREFKQKCFCGIDMDCNALSDSNKGEDCSIHHASHCNEMNIDPFVEEDEIWTDGDEQFADEKSDLQKESDKEGRKNCSSLNCDLHCKMKSKCKEVRNRSLFELTEKGRKSGSESYSLTKISRSMPKIKGGKFLKNAEGNKHHVGGSRKFNAEKCNHDQRSLSVMDSDAFCCVCGGSNKDEINCLLECSRCFIKVHQACYGVSRVPKSHWCCRPCRTSSKDIVCVLCGYGGGAMTRALRSRTIVKSLLKAWNVETEFRSKIAAASAEIMEDDLSVLHSHGSTLEGNAFPVLKLVNIESSAANLWRVNLQNQLDNVQKASCFDSDLKVHNSIIAGVLDSTVKQWVHMVCGLWTPGTRCPNVDTMSAFDVSGASRLKANVVCSMCNRPGGSCIQCRVVNCSVQFHPWCAHQKGLLQSEVEGVDNENVGFYGRCALHATQLLCESGSDPIDTEVNCLKENELTCARTEGYKGRKRDGFWYNLYGQSRGKSGCLVPHEQLNAWIHINGQKLCTRVLSKLPASEIENDCRKEYARYKQSKGWKHLVVYKSGIHALGLYTSRFISRGEMVVEYVGEIVGLRVADKRENEYQSGRKLQYKSACYFFRIDKEHIIDATCKGGIARFVNHSCLPNCVAKVISVRNEKKVVFFAERDINPGEEITYDYHFNHEDEGKKIPCFCNSKNCRRYLN